MFMSPEQAIENLDRLTDQFDKLWMDLNAARDEAADQWQGLGKVGGQRADHAAALLGKLRPHLRRVARLASQVEQQIDGWIADPFQQKEQPTHA
jgi:hypothetical protein